jgi:hypothetical protein
MPAIRSSTTPHLSERFLHALVPHGLSACRLRDRYGPLHGVARSSLLDQESTTNGTTLALDQLAASL